MIEFTIWILCAAFWIMVAIAILLKVADLFEKPAKPSKPIEVIQFVPRPRKPPKVQPPVKVKPGYTKEEMQ